MIEFTIVYIFGLWKTYKLLVDDIANRLLHKWDILLE